jgi:CO/xanthine dehydrogenase FAD-binding subunit
MAYSSPRSLDEALLLHSDGSFKVLAGGTDVFPALAERPLTGDVLDISCIESLRGIWDSSGGWRIGALTSWTSIARADLPPAFDGLKAAAREIGSVQIQNAGTVGGNLCNASPAADSIPPLLTLDAEVEIASLRGRRRLPLADFVLGVRRTALEQGELLVAVHVPLQTSTARSHFGKLGARRYLVISIAMVAILVDCDGKGRIREARIAVGACSPVALRLTALEQELAGKRLDDAPGLVAERHAAPLTPIDDVRGSAAYRTTAALELVRRGLAQLGSEAAP